MKAPGGLLGRFTAAMVLWHAVVACAGAPVAGAAPESDLDQPRVEVRVRLFDPPEAPEAAHLDVELFLPDRLVDRAVVELPFYGEPFAQADGYGAFVTGPAGPFDGTVEAVEGGRRARYRVALDHASRGPQHGLDEVPHRTSRGWVWVGRAFIPILKLDRVIREDLPARLTIDAAGLRGQGYHEGRLGELTHRLYILGPLHERVVRHGAATVRIVSSDYDTEALLPLAQLVQATLAEAEAHLGQAPAGTRRLIYDRQPQGFAGGVIGGDISLMSSTPPSVSALSPVGAVVVHELIHLWIQGEVPWLAEGLTSYFELALGLRIDRADTTRAALELSRLLLRHESHGASAHPVRHAEGPSAYSGGALLGVCLAARLRAAGRTLGSVIGTAAPLEPDHLARRALTPEGLRRELVSVAPSVERGLDALLDAGKGELERCLEEAGYRVESRDYLGYTLRALVVEVLGITSFSPQRAEVFRVRPGSVFEAGDIILSVAQRSVPSPATPASSPKLAGPERVQVTAIALIPQLDEALAGLAAGAEVTFEVERAGVPLQVVLSIPEVPASSRETRHTWVVTPSPSALLP